MVVCDHTRIHQNAMKEILPNLSIDPGFSKEFASVYVNIGEAFQVGMFSKTVKELIRL